MSVGIRRPFSVGVVSLCVLVGGLVFTSAQAVAAEPPEAPSCANEQRRAEQPYGLKLPDCRAYEMVSPLETIGQDATDSFLPSIPRASLSGEAITYGSRGAFADPKGSVIENQLISRRGPGGWSTQNITPLHHPQALNATASYEAAVFTPELTEGIANTDASLTGQAPVEELTFGLYVDNFTTSSYQYISAAHTSGFV